MDGITFHSDFVRILLHDMVQPGLLQNNPVLKSTVIITSRPIASGDLHQCASSRIEILGFTAKELESYFTECLKHDTKAVETLFERINENPAISGSCYLPMIASFLVHIFEINYNSLPITLYGISLNLFLAACTAIIINSRIYYNIH